MRLSWCRLVLAVGLSVGLGGCQRWADPQHREEPANLDPGAPAPQIEGQDLGGKTFRLSDYRGKVVLLHFWKTT
jgi:hypothetical protein